MDNDSALLRAITLLDAIEVPPQYYAVEVPLLGTFVVYSRAQLTRLGSLIERGLFISTARARQAWAADDENAGVQMPRWWKPDARFTWRIQCADAAICARLEHKLDSMLRFPTREDAEFACDSAAIDFGIERKALTPAPITADLATGDEIPAQLHRMISVSSLDDSKVPPSWNLSPTARIPTRYFTDPQYRVTCFFTDGTLAYEFPVYANARAARAELRALGLLPPLRSRVRRATTQ